MGLAGRLQILGFVAYHSRLGCVVSEDLQMEAKKKKPDSNNYGAIWWIHHTELLFDFLAVAVLTMAVPFGESSNFLILLAIYVSTKVYFLPYLGKALWSFELDAVVLDARTGLSDVPRRVLSPNRMFGQRSELHSRAIAGLTATLASLEVEPGVVVSRSYPFPEHCTREDLVIAIVFSCGVGRSAAEHIFDELASSLKELLAEAQLHSSAAVEVFPIGLYESVTGDGARFSSQPFVLKRGYPELGRALKDFERERAKV
jgi:hypothetical protein